MGLANDLHVDVDPELGSMPPLPRPHPTTRSPLSVVSSRSSVATRKSSAHGSATAADDAVMTEGPPPAPHAHPLQGFRPTAAGGAMVEHMRRPARSRPVDVQRLDPTMLSRDRVVALAKQAPPPSDPTALEIVPHSTRALQAQIQQIERAPFEPRPLTDDELRFAATDAAELRQLGYDGMDPDNRRLLTAAPAPLDSALSRARQRKVKKQVDARWLEMRNDPALRPRGPLERQDERDFYDSVNVASLEEIVEHGVLYDEHDLQSAMTVNPIKWDDMAVDRRGTTGLSGSCFDDWSFP